MWVAADRAYDSCRALNLTISWLLVWVVKPMAYRGIFEIFLSTRMVKPRRSISSIPYVALGMNVALLPAQGTMLRPHCAKSRAWTIIRYTLQLWFLSQMEYGRSLKIDERWIFNLIFNAPIEMVISFLSKIKIHRSFQLRTIAGYPFVRQRLENQWEKQDR